MARLPLLSTYLGHACISDTEVYLRNVYELDAKASANRIPEPALPTAYGDEVATAD